MDKELRNEEIINNVLVHMYHSVVVGSLESIAIILRMTLSSGTMNPRHKDLKGLYDTLGPEGRRLFFDSVVAIAEFAAYGTLDFVERYNRFDSEENRSRYPRLSLTYNRVLGEEANQVELSHFGSEELGQSFKRIARNDEIKSIVNSTIANIMDGIAKKAATDGGGLP